MYKCPQCKKFASVGPGTCWRCGVRLVNMDPPGPLGPPGPPRPPDPPGPPDPPVLRLRLVRRRKILFVGCIDGIPELDFITHLRWTSCTAHITSYQEAPQALLNLDGQTHHGATIVVEQHVDATALLERYEAGSFDAVVWIGPTCDGNLPKTPELVGLFVTSAGKVLVQGGVVFVVQDLKTPNFRSIMALPGAFFCCELSLQGRTQTQHSDKLKKMDERVDHLIAFTFVGGHIVHHGTNNDDFLKIFGGIMAVPAKKWPKHGKSKQEIAAIIFGFAKNL